MTLYQKNRGLFLTLLLCFLSYTTFSQSRYNDYSRAEKTATYNEDFDAPSSSWEGYETGRRSGKIENGRFLFSSLNDKTQVKYRVISLDWTGDWEIEIAINWISGKETSAIDLIWDKESGNSNKYHFGFTAGRKYVLAEYKDDKYNHILKFIPSDLVNRSSRNILTVRKVRQTYYFFVNKTLIKTLAYKKVKGDLVGFTVPPNTSISVDYFYAYQLNKEQISNTITSSAVSAKTYNSYNAGDMTKVYREDFSQPNTKWEVYRSGSRMGKIHDGVLDWISMNNSAQMIWHTLDDMNWSRDWQIEARVKFVTGKENSSNDLIWNIAEDGKNKYHFGFTGQGKYVFSKKVGSEYQSIVPFTASDLVNTSQFNKITIRKQGTNYYYFFNERLLTTKSYHTVTSDKVGFMVAPNTTIQIDYLDVSYLKPKSSVTTSTSIPSGKNYVGVMTKYSGLSTQRWKTRDIFPKDEIKSDWDAGYHVSDLSYDNDKWTLIMSKGTGFSTQTWITRKEWPKADIKEKWDEGYRITETNYGNGVWAIVFSKGSSFGRQRWATKGSAFPSDKIKEFGDDGLWITDLAYGVDRWVLVSSQDSNIRGQKWFKKAQFPESEIKEYQDMGYSITQLSRENNWWVLIMTKYASSRPQELISSSTFPKEEIREYWDKGYYLTDITYAETTTTSTSTRSTTVESKANANISELIVGKWYGGVPDENDNGYFTFDSDKFVTMVSGDETIGGRNYEVDGVTLDLKYEIDNSKTPANIDLVFYSGSTAFGRLKGLIKMLDDDSFEIVMSSELTDPRPSSLTEVGSQKVAVFKRVN
ncbi:hypothetical protein [Roseivirga sp. E12]|uniref:DUF7477 domain-containing protein n=1 Tax=Roseivirga sp. E12 TaxID=2819237 RepID=UPI001ABC416D|nr:hypothetical protein [Roseivirga sp. E12]MBO3699208.1 hypothetical protein [Roseivirga sp. E12]